MTNTPAPGPVRAAYVAALIQSLLLGGATVLWATFLVVSQRYEHSAVARSDPSYPHGLSLAVWGTLIVLTIGALALVAIPALRLRRGKRHARRWLVIGEIVTLVPIAVVTGATIRQHYFGVASWILIAYVAAAVIALVGPSTHTGPVDHRM